MPAHCFSQGAGISCADVGHSMSGVLSAELRLRAYWLNVQCLLFSVARAIAPLAFDIHHIMLRVLTTELDPYTSWLTVWLPFPAATVIEHAIRGDYNHSPWARPVQNSACILPRAHPSEDDSLVQSGRLHSFPILSTHRISFLC